MTHSLRRMYEMKADPSIPLSDPGMAFAPGGQNNLASVVETVRQVTLAMQAARSEGVKAYSDLGRSAQEWSIVANRAATQVVTMLSRHTALEIGSVATHAKAEQAKSFSTVSALKHTAFYKAIEATAAGFQALGNFDFWAAAQDFTSAALWGTAAGMQVAGMAGGAARGGGAAHGYGRSGGAFSHSVSAGIGASGMAAGSTSAAHGPSGNLTVAIMGDSDAGEWLANTLNTAVEQRGVQLTATRSVQSPYAKG